MLIPPKSKKDPKYLEESKQHSKRSEFYIASGTTQEPKLLRQGFWQRREGQKNRVEEVRVVIDRQIDETDSEHTKEETVQLDEQEKQGKRQEHITPYRPSGKWRLFWWRVGKVGKWIGEKSGFKNKTLWDVLQLGLLPIVITAMTLIYNSSQSSLQKRMEDSKYRQTALDNYITEMTKIIIDRDLPGVGFTPTDNLKGEPQVPAQNPSDDKKQEQRKYLANIAKAKTLTTLLLLDLDQQKRNIVLDFLRTENLCCEKPQEKVKNPIYLLEDIRLENSDLRGSDLSGFNLNKIKLINAKLDNAKLIEANLQNATLTIADLTGAELNGADLTNAQLGYADFSDSFLKGAKLTGADLQQANLKGADLSEASQEQDKEPQKTDLSKARLQGASLQNANLSGAILVDAKLGIPQAQKKNMRLRTDLRNANLQNANLERADLTGANLRGAKLQYADLMEAILDKADLSNANLHKAKGGETSKAKLCNTTMQDGDVQYRDCWFNIFHKSF